MRASTRTKISVIAGCTILLAGFAFAWSKRATLSDPRRWQRQVMPGDLSSAHAFLKNDCASCHTANQGVEAGKCIVCHANNQSLLQRQPTAFHADIGSCTECHGEHHELPLNPRQMDHTALAKIGLRQAEAAIPTTNPAREKLLNWIKQSDGSSPLPQTSSGVNAHESLLNCANCHANQDRHVKLLGQDCSQCHGTSKWTIQEFRHPSANSTDCAQCHQAPPSHYMEHFNMVSVVVAGKPHAKVTECYLCHQTTSWNDIKGVGWYKHH